MSRSETVLLVLHLLVWIALAIAAYATAGPYKLASCWPIILLYFWPAAVLLLAIAGISMVTLLISLILREWLAHPIFSLGRHGMLLTLGWIGCTMAAYAAAGQVNCL